MKSRYEFKEGDVIEGRITGIQPYGIFIKLNDECSGLVHATELEKLENENPSRFFKIGQSLKVKVLRVKPGGRQAVLKLQRATHLKRRMGARGFETENGFLQLKRQLPIWVREAKNNHNR
ncbi:MAG: S1 RNA-binding domain-containing protein [Defluviitaleaceae bacterium]|nr:S1 RNA-binding domain-containing protein [Defluviitaleaceae bacterium]